MVATPHPNPLTSSPTARRRLSRRWNRTLRRLRQDEMAYVTGLILMVVGLGVASIELGAWVPVTAVIVPMLLGHLVLGPRSLPWFVVFALTAMAVIVAVESENLDGRRVGGIVVAFAVGLVILVSSFRRSRLGVAGSRGESMLVDLRDRLSQQGTLPKLPDHWYAEAVLRSAGGSAFSGDFIAASKSPDGRHLEVAVVDVSGKGEQAGTRALLLSGAFGGLLGALPPEEFLPAANDYLIRQDWSEGFATAIHLSLDLQTGDFEVRSAGHPPAVQLNSGSGRWGIHGTEGPVLGLMANATFTCVSGRVQRGDALLLYTDGLVETPYRDISQGIDKLLGQGERLLRAGFERGARRLIDRLESENDDRALFMLHRR